MAIQGDLGKLSQETCAETKVVHFNVYLRRRLPYIRSRRTHGARLSERRLFLNRCYYSSTRIINLSQTACQPFALLSALLFVNATAFCDDTLLVDFWTCSTKDERPEAERELFACCTNRSGREDSWRYRCSIGEARVLFSISYLELPGVRAVVTYTDGSRSTPEPMAMDR